MSINTAVDRSNRIMRVGADYAENIENRLRRRGDYQRATQRVNAAYRNRANDYQEYREAYKAQGDMYNNTAYSRRSYMGLNNG